MKRYLILILSLLFLLFSCKKTPEAPNSTNKITLPFVVTSEVSNITINSAICGGNVTDAGNGTVSARGVCWDIQSNPTLSNNTGYTVDGNGIGLFSSDLTDLIDSTDYYVVAYATNEKGTSYGEIKTFQTIPLFFPEVTTSEISQIQGNSATCGGEITDAGNGTVIARGVCWDTQANPSLENNTGYSNDGNGIGVFLSEITGLAESTPYYIVAYATNEKGTSYGEIKTFVTLVDYCDGIFTINYEGQVYHTLSIGEQCWMKENLNYAIGNSSCYDDNASNCAKYGRLYDWQTALGACPSGWHLPTDDEWKILEGTVDTQYGVGSVEWNDPWYRGFDAGKRLKTTTGWNSNNGTDIYGFSALPGGNWYSDGSFGGLGEAGYWWSSTEDSSSNTWNRGMYYSKDNVYRYSPDMDYGYSVRCIKD